MILRALKHAFPYTIPILAGYGFLGMTYGIYASSCGFGFLYPMLMGLFIYGGSLEFVTVSMLLAPFAPLQSFIMALMIQARHLFYGIAMLDRFKGLSWKRFYLIYGMSDETFSVTCTAEIPEDVDRGWFYLWVTFLDQMYWVGGAAIGGIVGDLITFNTEGLEFVMTAMFVVILLEQWFKERTHIHGWVGAAASIVCLLICGPDNFLIPSMICILAALMLLRGLLEQRTEQQAAQNAGQEIDRVDRVLEQQDPRIQPEPDTRQEQNGQADPDIQRDHAIRRDQEVHAQ